MSENLYFFKKTHLRLITIHDEFQSHVKKIEQQEIIKWKMKRLLELLKASLVERLMLVITDQRREDKGMA